MRQMMKANGVWRTLKQESAPALLALIIAEVFFKFHSFTLECVAFLATWYVLSWIAERIGNAIVGLRERQRHGSA